MAVFATGNWKNKRLTTAAGGIEDRVSNEILVEEGTHP